MSPAAAQRRPDRQALRHPPVWRRQARLGLMFAATILSPFFSFTTAFVSAADMHVEHQQRLYVPSS